MSSETSKMATRRRARTNPESKDDSYETGQSRQDHDPSQPPSTEADINPTPTSAIPRFLSVLAIFAIFVALAYRTDHPVTAPLRSKVEQTVERIIALTKKKPPADPVYAADDDSESAPPPKIAVCYSGQVGTHAEVYQQNLDALSQADPHAHIFYYLDLHDSYLDPKTAQIYEEDHDIKSLHTVFENVKARKVLTYSTAAIPKPPVGLCYKRKGSTEEHYSHYFEKFYAAARCYDLIKAAEQQLKISYDWIVSMQLNMKISIKMPDESLKRRVHMSGAALSLIPREHADLFFSIEQAFSGKSCEVLDLMGDQPCRNYSYEDDCVECFIVKWLSDGGVVPSNGVYVNRRIVFPTQ